MFDAGGDAAGEEGEFIEGSSEGMRDFIQGKLMAIVHETAGEGDDSFLEGRDHMLTAGGE